MRRAKLVVLNFHQVKNCDLYLLESYLAFLVRQDSDAKKNIQDFSLEKSSSIKTLSIETVMKELNQVVREKNSIHIQENQNLRLQRFKCILVRKTLWKTLSYQGCFLLQGKNRNLREMFSVWLSKVHSRYQGEFFRRIKIWDFLKIYNFFSDWERKFFGLWLQKFLYNCQNSILRVQRKILW